MNHTFHYVGHTQDVQKRLDQHNSGLVQSTKHYAPFTLETYIAVKTERKAIELEKYLKAGSGKAVLMKRFLS